MLGRQNRSGTRSIKGPEARNFKYLQQEKI